MTPYPPANSLSPAQIDAMASQKLKKTTFCGPCQVLGFKF
jgi:hypothetical protein